eukprot:Nk52_evm5s1916 gene=Nk52_evmTU5s1916
MRILKERNLRELHADIRASLCTDPKLEDWPEVLKSTPHLANEIELLKPHSGDLSIVSVILESMYKGTIENLANISDSYIQRFNLGSMVID